MPSYVTRRKAPQRVPGRCRKPSRHGRNTLHIKGICVTEEPQASEEQREESVPRPRDIFSFWRLARLQQLAILYPCCRNCGTLPVSLRTSCHSTDTAVFCVFQLVPFFPGAKDKAGFSSYYLGAWATAARATHRRQICQMSSSWCSEKAKRERNSFFSKKCEAQGTGGEPDAIKEKAPHGRDLSSCRVTGYHPRHSAPFLEGGQGARVPGSGAIQAMGSLGDTSVS